MDRPTTSWGSRNRKHA